MGRWLRRLWFSPLLIAHAQSGCQDATERDARRSLQPDHTRPLPAAASLLDILDCLARPEFRSVFYARLSNDGPLSRVLALVLRRLYRGQVALVFSCPEIGGGLYMLHGFATIVVAKRIGTDCLIAQQVTVGYGDAGRLPTLGDRVRIGAGAKVIGEVHVGDDASIGANAVVVKDVPAGAVVGGVPARILKQS